MEYRIDTYADINSGKRIWVVLRGEVFIAECLNQHYAQMFADAANERERLFQEACATTEEKVSRIANLFRQYPYKETNGLERSITLSNGSVVPFLPEDQEHFLRGSE